MEKKTKKRVFFAYSVEAPWPEKRPKGRRLIEKDRHLTTVFLGEIDYSLLEPHLAKVPRMPWEVGPCGVFDKVLFLPYRRPSVVSWNVEWLGDGEIVTEHVIDQKKYFQEHDLLKSKSTHHEWLPHCSVCRHPHSIEEWKAVFRPLPMMITGFYLYEALGYSQYRTLWGAPCTRAIDAVENSSERAFIVRGQEISHLHRSAELALAFEFPEVTPYLGKRGGATTFDDMILRLNDLVGELNASRDSLCRSIRYHGGKVSCANALLEWEMIIDV